MYKNIDLVFGDSIKKYRARWNILYRHQILVLFYFFLCKRLLIINLHSIFQTKLKRTESKILEIIRNGLQSKPAIFFLFGSRFSASFKRPNHTSLDCEIKSFASQSSYCTNSNYLCTQYWQIFTSIVRLLFWALRLFLFQFWFMLRLD